MCLCKSYFAPNKWDRSSRSQRTYTWSHIGNSTLWRYTSSKSESEKSTTKTTTTSTLSNRLSWVFAVCARLFICYAVQQNLYNLVIKINPSFVHSSMRIANGDMESKKTVYAFVYIYMCAIYIDVWFSPTKSEIFRLKNGSIDLSTIWICLWDNSILIESDRMNFSSTSVVCSQDICLASHLFHKTFALHTLRTIMSDQRNCWVRTRVPIFNCTHSNTHHTVYKKMQQFAR